MKNKNKRRISILVTAQTSYNLRRLADLAGYHEPGMVVDKLVRDRLKLIRPAGGFHNSYHPSCTDRSKRDPCELCGTLNDEIICRFTKYNSCNQSATSRYVFAKFCPECGRSLTEGLSKRRLKDGSQGEEGG